MTQWVSAPGTCRMIDPGPDRESPTCLSCGRVIIKTVRPSGATWWTHEDSTTGRVLTADEIVPPAEPLPIEREEHERISAPDYMGATPYGDDPE